VCPLELELVAKNFDRFSLSGPVQRQSVEDASIKICREEAQKASIHRPIGEGQNAGAPIQEFLRAFSSGGLSIRGEVPAAQCHIRYVTSIRRPHRRICSFSRLTGSEFYSFAGCYIQHPEIIRFFVYIPLDHGDTLAVRRKDRRAIHVARSNLAERFALAVE
jgi:hypothetical protein